MSAKTIKVLKAIKSVKQKGDFSSKYISISIPRLGKNINEKLRFAGKLF